MRPNSETLPARRRTRSTSGLWFSATVMLVSLTSEVAAAEKPTGLVSESEYFTDIPLVLSATRLAQPRSETPAAVTVIDRDMIHASGARQIADLFRLVPGFQVAYENGYSPKVTYHGQSDQYPRRMQILIDGRSVYSSMFGGAYWADLPLALEDIERIEVVRGPNAVAYGSNAFLGVINITTRHPAQDPGTFVKATSGDNRTRDGLVRHAWTGTDSDTRLSVGFHGDNGYDDRPDSDHTRFVNLRSEFRASTADTIELQLGGSLAAREDGMQGDIAKNIPRYVDTTDHFQQLRWRHRLDAGDEFSVQYYHNYHRLDDSYITEPLLALGGIRIPIGYGTKEERQDLEFQHTLSPLPGWRFVWGAGVRDDRVRSPIWFSTDEILKNSLYRLFGNAEWRASPDTIINAGAMMEKTNTTGTNTSPRLALNYHVTPEHTLRAAVSQAYRMPEPPELRGNHQYFYNGVLVDQDIVGSEQNKSEVMTSTEFGYFGQLPERHLQWDIRIARDQMRDVFSSTAIPSTDIYNQLTESLINDAIVTTDSAEAQLEYRPNRDTRIALTHAQMVGKSTNRLPSEGWFNQKRIESVPRFSSSLLATHRLYGEWYGSMVYSRVAYMLWLGTGDYIEPYSRVDLRLARKLHLGTTHGEAAAVIQNANHNNYADFREENMFYRRVFFTLSLDVF